MKSLTFAGETFQAERIIKAEDSIIGYIDKTEVFAYRGITDFSGFQIDGEYDQNIDELTAIRQENTQLKLAIAELAMNQEENNINNRLALAELAALIGGE